jgi:hypothetical protein
MNTPETTDYEAILKIVRDWPPARRITLMQEVLKTLAPIEAGAPPHGATLDRALGLLATTQPVPSDEDIARWLDERRMERYGR